MFVNDFDQRCIYCVSEQLYRLKMVVCDQYQILRCESSLTDFAKIGSLNSLRIPLCYKHSRIGLKDVTMMTVRQ